MSDTTRIAVIDNKTDEHIFSYDGYYVPGKGEVIDHGVSRYKVKKVVFFTDLPDDAAILVKEIKD